MRKTIFLLVLFILTIGGQKISAQTEESSCSIEAWVTDKDPKGLNVRSQPNATSKILGTLKITGNDNDEEITVNVIGYSNGWVKISGATKISGDEVFSGLGWVSAKMVATGTKGDKNYDDPVQLYAAAKTSSKKTGTIPSESSVRIAGFSCGWIKVELNGKSGWIRTLNICGNPVTTCS